MPTPGDRERCFRGVSSCCEHHFTLRIASRMQSCARTRTPGRQRRREGCQCCRASADDATGQMGGQNHEATTSFQWLTAPREGGRSVSGSHARGGSSAHEQLQSAIPTIAAVIGIGDRSRETSRAHDQRQNVRETDCCVSWGCRFLGDSKVRTGWPNVRDS